MRFGGLLGATWPVGTTAHTWQAAAASGDFGVKTAVYIAKALAGTAYDLFDDAVLLEDAWTDFEAARGQTTYESPLPADADPPFDLAGQ